MDTGSVLGIIGVVFSVATALVGALNHSRIRSKCCKKEFVASIDIEKTTPIVENGTGNTNTNDKQGLSKDTKADNEINK